MSLFSLVLPQFFFCPFDLECFAIFFVNVVIILTCLLEHMNRKEFPLLMSFLFSFRVSFAEVALRYKNACITAVVLYLFLSNYFFLLFSIRVTRNFFALFITLFKLEVLCSGRLQALLCHPFHIVIQVLALSEYVYVYKT